jgi:exopolysaccharide production protein ExoZ
VRLKSIQALRALAAILVAYAHSIDTQMQFSVSRQQNFYFLQNFGAIGVDLFFVISGFIITFVACEAVGAQEGGRFLLKRFIRVNPVYYVASLFHESVLLGLILVFLPPSIPFSIYVRPLPAALRNTLLVVPTAATLAAYRPLLVIGWTLAFEWLFYFLFFLLILIGTPYKAGGLFAQILLLVAAGRLLHVADYRFIFLTNPILLEFLLGVAICWFYLGGARVPRWLPVVCLLAGLAGYAYSVRYGYGAISEMWPVLSGRVAMPRVLWWGVPSALIVAGCVFLERGGRLRRLWSNRLLQSTGDASYSLYLVHLTVFTLCKLAYASLGFFLNPDVAILAQVLLAVAAGLAFYRYVEAPMLRGLHRWCGV